MAKATLLPTSDIEQSKRFYQRLGFSLGQNLTNKKVALTLIREEIVLEFYLEANLNPLKNSSLSSFSVLETEKLAKELAEKFAPEDTDCPGWLLPLKNGEIHVVDPSGNLIMIRRKAA
ncbi:MAG: hypothetical protein K2P81_01635 [Bacteriovoracaceae bacterium]|nr:hypothetical protein [Bacteriovoracaceae bacterium]